MALDYQFTDDVMAYVNVSTGYKGGGINPRPFYLSQVLGFEPETLTTYEIGFKSDFADNRVRVNLAAFFNKYEDIILRLNVCPTDIVAQRTPCQLPANVGSADVKGVELETNMLLGAGFSVDLAASWMDFEYTETDFVRTGIPDTFVTPYTPEVKGSLGLQWETPFAGDHTFVARVDLFVPGPGVRGRIQQPVQPHPQRRAGQPAPDVARSGGQVGGVGGSPERDRRALLPGDERLLGVGGHLELLSRSAAHLGADGETHLRMIRESQG